MPTKRVSIRCSLSPEILCYLLFCYATSGTCWKMHLNYKHYLMVSLIRTYTEERVENKSAIFYILTRLKLSNLIHLDVFYNIYFIFPKTKKKQFQKYICLHLWFFYKTMQIRDGSLVGLSILHNFMQRNRLERKHYNLESSSCRPLFFIKISRTRSH